MKGLAALYCNRFRCNQQTLSCTAQLPGVALPLFRQARLAFLQALIVSTLQLDVEFPTPVLRVVFAHDRTLLEQQGTQST